MENFHTAPQSFLRKIINQPLCYALKSPDLDLYDFGFGKQCEVLNRSGQPRKLCEYVLHATCRFQVMWRDENPHIDTYDEYTSQDMFQREAKHFIGLRVQDVTLSSKNDLWLDMGNCWIVFATFDDDEESWRMFMPGGKQPHLVASSLSCCFD